MPKTSPLYLPQWGSKRRRLMRMIHTFVLDSRFMFHVSRFTFIAGCLLLSCASFAQGNVAMADSMRSNGKIYVVVAVCLTILIGLFIYVLMIDKKISRFEKNND
jgi:hypothetical protein